VLDGQAYNKSEQGKNSSDSQHQRSGRQAQSASNKQQQQLVGKQNLRPAPRLNTNKHNPTKRAQRTLSKSPLAETAATLLSVHSSHTK
jgi:hypothetical protein